MKTSPWWNREAAFWWVAGFALLAGFWLRWYLLTDQVLADDEWHGLYYVIGKSPGWLLTHFSIPGATCIPLNLYTWLLGKYYGWSELSLRLPSLVCGILLVAGGPLLARKFIGPGRTVLLLALLAISPLLIFYSRICRPYSAVAFFGFAALLLAAHWMRSGNWRSGALFAVAGVLAIYFHLFAVVTVAAPMLVVLIALIRRRVGKKTDDATSFPTGGQVVWVGAAIALGSSVLVLPALVHSVQSTFFTIALTGKLQLQTVPKMAMLISGTGQPLLAGLFWIAVVAGMVEQCRRHPRLGWMLLSLYPLHALALVLSRPDSAQSAIVLTRYCIPLVPVSLFFAACGIQSALEILAARATLQPALQAFVGLIFVLALAATGPLPQCYAAPNNFTAHGAYQHHYGPIDWQRSFYSDLTPADFPFVTTIRVDEISPFYGTLAKSPGNRPVVEYPMMIGDHFDPLYYYQHFHHRPVIVGYTTDLSLPKGLAAGNIFGDTYVDQVLTLAPDPSRLRFRNLISMDDLAGMRARGVEFIILHKRFEAQLPAVAMPLPDLKRLWDEYHQALGAPYYEDAHIAVFRL